MGGWFPQWHDRDLFARIAEPPARADRPIQVQVQVQVLSVPPDPKALEQLAAAGVEPAAVRVPRRGRGRVIAALTGG
ncbi:hypothetical protein [Actinoplanes sp. NPDC049599]|uniref:hypothetical protein n=1 Tax=Actinoplanes sp. NPDC049599 TaxID=3363903 RepID=UPI0037988CFB